MPDSHNRPTRGYGWVFYDVQCPMCLGWVNRFTKVLLRRRFLTAPLQRGWVQQRLELDSNDAFTEMRVLTRDGQVLGGAEAVVYLACRIWWARPFAVIANLPGVMGILGRAYQSVARRRRRNCKAPSCTPANPSTKSVPRRVQVEPDCEADRAA